MKIALSKEKERALPGLGAQVSATPPIQYLSGV